VGPPAAPHTMETRDKEAVKATHSRPNHFDACSLCEREVKKIDQGVQKHEQEVRKRTD